MKEIEDINITLKKQKNNFFFINQIELERLKEGRKKQINSEWGIVKGNSEENLNRNRYANIFPWDQTRIKLKTISEKHSDYINASEIKIDNDNIYIATQGPLKETMHHFWSMIFNESVKQKSGIAIIVMVTPLVENGIVKCHQYWPKKINQKLSFKENYKKDGIDVDSEILEVTFVDSVHETENEYIINRFKLCSQDIEKDVYQFFYFNWSDNANPNSLNSLLHMCEKIRNIRNQKTANIIPIVHCSAGVGRSGTFIAIDYLFNNKKKILSCKKNYTPVDKFDPVLSIVLKMREGRMKMVQTLNQFIFLYDAAKFILK